MIQPITFTEDDIISNANRFGSRDARMLPKTGKGADHRTGICKCGKKSGPYASCRKCREHATLRKAITKAENEGMIERVHDGRGRKGGRVWRKTAAFEALCKAEKDARTIRRDAPKIERNSPCACGSGRKFKNCCI